MTEGELREALDGLYAYDGGSTDSGIHDEALRVRVKAQLVADAALAGPNAQVGPRLSRITRDLFLSDEAVEQGYGLEDVAGFLTWLAEYMDFDIR